jgi:GNAT superfamily N-acetyltransferase
MSDAGHVSTYQVQTLDPRDRVQAGRCFRVFSSLRPHLTEEQFVQRLLVQAEEHYAVVYIELDGEVGAAAGYRLANFLAWGKVLYIDDLVTDPGKTNRGMGGALLDWLLAEAKAKKCDEVHLDTGYQRHDAHRLYLNKGFVLRCHHLSRRLT